MLFFWQKISAQDKADLFKSLAMMLKNGTPINTTFEVLSEQVRSEPLKKLLITVQERIETGSTLSEVLEENGNFDPVSINFIKAGEESGMLTENLIYLADWIKDSNKLRKEIKNATLYPKIILGVALLLGTGITVFVLPRLVPVFGTLNVELPLTTRILLWFSEFVGQSWLLLLVAILIFVIGLIGLLHWRPVKFAVHRLMLRLPMVKYLVRDYQLTIMAQLMSVLIKSGSTITETLGIVQHSVTNLEYQRVLKKIARRVDKGTDLAEALADYPDHFPGVFVSMITTAEQSGTFDESFEYLAEHFSERVKDQTERLPVILEPILLIFIGLMVAFLAISIILPMYDITQGLR